MNGRRITTHEAMVKTAAIEIKALTISGKQVTLAVFRQLPRGHLIHVETCELRGVPWGRVNYHADCLDEYYHESLNLRPFEHLHVVWQEGEELRQDVIPEHPAYDADSAEEQQQRRAFMERWSHLYRTLTNLDQLFIAV